jgi:hypothetical protein
MNYQIDYNGLKEFLKTLTYKGIKDGALTKAHARNDIDFFYKTDEEKSKITLDQVVEYGQPFLVDAIGNDLSVCILTKRKYKLPTGRVVRIKFDRTIIDDCRRVFGSPVNDYYVIPDRFIKLK